MTKSQNNNNPQGKAMEFPQKEDIVIVDEKKTNVFEAQQITRISVPASNPGLSVTAPSEVKINNWIDAYSDCA